MTVAVDWATGGLFLAGWLCVIVSVLAVDAIAKIARATRRESDRWPNANGDSLTTMIERVRQEDSRRQRGGGSTQQRGTQP